MDEQPSFVLKLSLTEIALRRVAVILWSEPDVLTLIAKTRSESLTYYGSENTQKTVESKLLKLALPKSLKKQIMHIIKPIGLEIYGWMEYHEYYLSDDTYSNSIDEFHVPILEKLCWTVAGVVDYKKTADELIRCELLSVVKRYYLACLYCLNDYIPTLWGELPEHFQNYFYSEKEASYTGEPFLQFYWPYILKGEEFKLYRSFGNPVRFNKYVFELSARRGYKAAAEYFFQKLSLEEKNSSLVDTALCVVTMRKITLPPGRMFGRIPLEKYSEMLFYLLSLMTPEQQMEIVKKEPASLLRFSLDWPWQDLFLEVATLVWAVVPASSYGDLLQEIYHGFITSNYCFPKLFQEFFMHSPVDFRKYFVDRECECGNFLSRFLSSQDSDAIKVIFRNIDAEDRVRLVSSGNFFSLLVDLMMEDKWHMMEVCLREAKLSKEDKKKLKGKAFKKFLPKYDEVLKKPRTKLKRRERKKLFQLLEQIYPCTPVKGSLKYTLTKAKKFVGKE